MSEFNKILNQKAVALSYDEEQSKAPVIVASGRGHMAERIIELACENDVPVYEDHSLANILSQMELGSEIPAELYQMVVDIYVYFLKLVPGSEQGTAVDVGRAPAPQAAAFRMQAAATRTQDGDYRMQAAAARTQDGEFRMQDGEPRGQDGDFRTQDDEPAPQTAVNEAEDEI